MTKRIYPVGRYVLVVVLCLFINNWSWGQTQRITLPAGPQNISGLFTYLQNQYGLRFFYNNDVVRPDQKISITARELTLSELLKELTDQTGLTFSLKDNNLIVVEDNRKQAVTQGTVTGQVTEAGTGNPVVGATVNIPRTSTGTLTDFEGRYTLPLKNLNDTLSFSFIGYITKKIPVNGNKVLDITLQEDVRMMDEVVVTALNINRTKTSLGYSISSITGEELNRARENNVINNLAGKVAGLQITKASTGVDGSTRVVLRGISSLTGENRPLIVVDGIPVDGGHGGGDRWGGTDQGDALSDLNPADIETMSILKGAGAAAAYGSRGANGVILITTKRGLLKKGLGVSLQSGYAVDMPLLYPDFQNSYGHGAFGNYPSTQPDAGMPWAWSYGSRMDGEMLPNYWGSSSAYLPQPNNYKDFFQTGSTLSNTIALESGNETSSVRASFTSNNSSGIIPNNDLKRQTINLRGFSRMNDILEFDGKVTYMHTRAENRPEVAEGSNNPGYMLSIMPRNMVNRELMDHNEDENGNEMLWTTDGYTNNPYWQLYNNVNWDEKHRLQGVLSTKINFTKTMNLLLRSGMDYTNRSAHAHKAIGSQGGGTGSTGNDMGNNLEWNSDFMFGYNPRLENRIQVTFNLGGNYRYNTNNGISQWGSNLKVEDYYAISNAGFYTTTEDFSEKAVYSLYGLSTISYNNWLYLDLTIRNDWSSTLPVENNSYMYHSENLSFLFTKAFGIESDFLTSGKLRTSFSKVGNDTAPYQTSKYYNVYQTQLPYPMGGFSDVLAPYDLQPEITKSWEIGTNLEFLKNLMVLDITYYRNNSENQIMNVPLSPSSGYTSKKMNAAQLNNTGFEVQLDATPVQLDNLQWNMTLTWSTNKSQVVKLASNLESIILEDIWHATIQARPGEEYGSIYSTDFKRDAFGSKLIGNDGYAQKGEYKKLGNINPDWLAGFSNTVRWRDFAISMLVDMRMGGEIYSMGRAYRSLFGTSLASLEGRNEWYATHDPQYNYTTPLPGVEEKGYVEDGVNEVTGQKNTVPVDPIYRWYNIWSKEIGIENILDATNIRLREISLGYSLPAKIISKSPLNDLRISLVARNVLFFYNAMKDIDPESGYSSGNTGGGFEHSAIPTTRSIGFNVTVNF